LPIKEAPMSEPHADRDQKKSIAQRLWGALWWILESQWWVVIEHSRGLEKCKKAGSPTAALVLIWAPIMCFPQWLVAPLFGWQLETLAIFGARMLAICIVRKLDDIMPLTRALGLCHLLTFGPVFTMLIFSFEPNGARLLFDWFVWSQLGVIGLCLFLDARDFYLYLAGQPYPCYIREGVRGGELHIDDPRAHEPVTWRSRLLGP
jgi:hypothetical protein